MRLARLSRLWSRRRFLVGTAGVGIAAFSVAVAGVQAPSPVSAGAPADTTKKVLPPPLKPELVREFVGAAHGNLDRTRELLDHEPGLLNATWDWKAGDFEAAIGGAGHMGRADIARFLIERGARMDLFVAAMLGELGIVKAILTAYPALAQSRGPHGITLMKHATVGGKAAEGVVAYLESLPKS
jgi:hypothetical protein